MSSKTIHNADSTKLVSPQTASYMEMLSGIRYTVRTSCELVFEYVLNL